MAKVKAPLFGLGARGQLGKALVYFPWKGIDCAREYVIPTNPKADLQVAQRNKLKAAVTEFHGASYTAIDVSAWTRYASILAKVMTGFNAMCRTHIKEAILGNTWERLMGGAAYNIIATSFEVRLWKESTGNVPDVHMGTSKTYMPEVVAMEDQGSDHWTALFLTRTPNTDYYFYMDCGSSGTDYGRTGIYKARTLPA